MEMKLEEGIQLLLEDMRNARLQYTTDNGIKDNDERTNRFLEDIRLQLQNDHLYVLRLAASSNHIELVNVLLEQYNVDPNADDNLALQWASENGHIGVVNRLLEDPRVNPGANRNASIRLASENGHLKVIDRLLEEKNKIFKDGILSRVDPSEYNSESVQSASLNGHIEVVNRLLEEKNVDPSLKRMLSDSSIFAKYDNRAIPIPNGHVKMKHRIAYPRIDPSPNNNEAIRWASQYGHNDIVYRLLEDSRVYNDEFVLDKFRTELGLLKELRIMRKRILDYNGIPEDLIYEICKYLHYSKECYKLYSNL
jgi:ankyrin repeat protein